MLALLKTEIVIDNEKIHKATEQCRGQSRHTAPLSVLPVCFPLSVPSLLTPVLFVLPALSLTGSSALSAPNTPS